MVNTIAPHPDQICMPTKKTLTTVKKNNTTLISQFERDSVMTPSTATISSPSRPRRNTGV